MMAFTFYFIINSGIVYMEANWIYKNQKKREISCYISGVSGLIEDL